MVSIHYEVVGGPDPIWECLLPGQLPGGGKGRVWLDKETATMVPYRSKMFTKWRRGVEKAQAFVAIPRCPRKAYDGGRVLLHIRYWWKDLIRRDADSMESALFWLLALKEKKVGRKRIKIQGTGVVYDDSQLVPAWDPQGLDRANPRCLIRLWRLAEESDA